MSINSVRKTLDDELLSAALLCHEVSRRYVRAEQGQTENPETSRSILNQAIQHINIAVSLISELSSTQTDPGT
jgi:hypothetical protein